MGHKNFAFILSGRYISSELVSEFGLLPPAFLPVGLQRLYVKQVAYLRKTSEKIFITLPDDYSIPTQDQYWFDKNNVEVRKVAPHASLVNALRDAAQSIEPESSLTILFGDTVVEVNSNFDENSYFAYGKTEHLATWTEFDLSADGKLEFSDVLYSRDTVRRKVVSGLLHFRRAREVINVSIEAETFCDFLNSFSSNAGLKPVEAIAWQDYGHISNYYNSRRNDLAARAFNSVKTSRHGVVKTSSNKRKIFAEQQWFEHAPAPIKPFLPKMFESRTEPDLSYETEYLYLPLVAELYVFGRLSCHQWTKILSCCFDFLIECRKHKPKKYEVPHNFEAKIFNDLVLHKTSERLTMFCEQECFDPNRAIQINGCTYPCITDYSSQQFELVSLPSQDDLGLMHGDFHFANIFYDSRAQRIITIDPRGLLNDGTVSIFGDTRYDLAKLAHSIIGRYDFIISGQYFLEEVGDYQWNFGVQGSDATAQASILLDKFIETSGYSRRVIIALMTILFLSMLPLHSDNKERQRALLLNAYLIGSL